MEMKFNSQICTTREQSERLLALGLKKETADMIHMWHWEFDGYTLLTVPWERAHRTTEDIPAWSLHRLIEMIPQEHEGSFFSLSLNDAGYSEPGAWVLYERVGTYDSIINCIEWLIKEGYFNKEYLED